MPNITVTWQVTTDATPGTIITAASVTFSATGVFFGSGETKTIVAVPVTFGPAQATFFGAGGIVGTAPEANRTVGFSVYGALRPVADPYDPARGYPLLAYALGIGSMLQELEDIVDHPEYLLDPDKTPAKWVPWLGQFIDAGIPENGSGNLALDRAAIKDPPRRRRGTVNAILEEIEKRLINTKTIFYSERGVGGSAWHGQIAVRADELAGGQTQQTLQALVNRIKPSVVLIDVGLVGVNDYNALLRTHTTYTVVRSVFSTYTELKQNPTKQ